MLRNLGRVLKPRGSRLTWPSHGLQGGESGSMITITATRVVQTAAADIACATTLPGYD